MKIYIDILNGIGAYALVSGSLLHAKRTLRARGWSYHRAAPQLGVCYQHLALVLTGRRESQRLLARIEAIPHRTQV